ncbi:hypothetical protein BTVI_02300 [Pitangus sulphuratus]|nr:hypothetical protein BTVI_02300 [Pitangus sulphuratus]
MLELQYELESKAAKWYATTDIANAFFSIPFAAEYRPQFAFTWRGNPNCPGILEIITNWPEGESFGLSSEEEEGQVTRAEEAPPYNQLPEDEKQYALFTDGSCCIVGTNRKWKAAVWSPTQRVAKVTKGQGGSSQVAELKAVQLALDIAEREKWPRLCLYTDSWMVANALWGWLE